MAADVIVPSVANLPGLSRLLESLAAQSLPHRLVVIDNGSHGAAASRLAGEHGAASIRFEENHGFSRAVNAGAVAAETDTIVVVNDDAVFEPEFLSELVSPLDPAAGVTMVAGVLREGADPSRIDSAGIELDHTLLGFDFLNGEPLSALATAADPFGPCAAAAAYDRAAFLELGGFDENLFAYLEDLDLAVRLRIAGGRCALAAGALGTHQHSGTLGSGSARKDYLTGFGRGYLLRKWGVAAGLRWGPVLARELPITLGQMLVDRNRAALRGRLSGWRVAGARGEYPTGALRGVGASGIGRTIVRRLRRRRRLRGSR